MKTSYALFLSIALLTSGCSSNMFINREDEPACKTVLTGSFNEVFDWDEAYPAMVLKNGSVVEALSFEMKEDGVDFVEKKSDDSDAVDTVFYSYDKVLALIDYEKKCVYGQAPASYYDDLNLKVQMNLKYMQDTTYTPIYIELEQKETFSYCVRPGTYIVKEILFNNDKGIDQSINIPYIKFIAPPDSITNLGSFSISLVDSAAANPAENTIYVPYKILQRHAESAAVGFLGGAIGAAILAAARESDTDIEGYYKIEVKYGEK